MERSVCWAFPYCVSHWYMHVFYVHSRACSCLKRPFLPPCVMLLGSVTHGVEPFQYTGLHQLCQQVKHCGCGWTCAYELWRGRGPHSATFRSLYRGSAECRLCGGRSLRSIADNRWVSRAATQTNKPALLCGPSDVWLVCRVRMMSNICMRLMNDAGYIWGKARAIWLVLHEGIWLP